MMLMKGVLGTTQTTIRFPLPLSRLMQPHNFVNKHFLAARIMASPKRKKHDPERQTIPSLNQPNHLGAFQLKA
jgi:hypothetical protein